MIPNIKQFKKWSLPSKYAFLGIILAIIPILFYLVDWVASIPEYAVIAFNHDDSEITIFGDAGKSTETAVIIRGANLHEAGVKAEYYWIKKRYPGYEVIRTYVYTVEQPARRTYGAEFKAFDPISRIETTYEPNKIKERYYDVLVIRNWYGRTHHVHFDITGFWLKGINIKYKTEWHAEEL
jgi:hypothetical protein